MFHFIILIDKYFNCFCNTFSFQVISLKYGLTATQLRDLYIKHGYDLDKTERFLIEEYEKKRTYYK